MIVIDASAVIELLLRTELGMQVEHRALIPEEHLNAPHLLDLEVVQVLRRMARLKEITLARANLALRDFRVLLVERAAHQALLERILQLRDSMTAYDGVYVALTEILNAPLLTCDGKLARSHGHRARIELLH